MRSTRAAVLAVALAQGCSHVSGAYVWVDDYPVPEKAKERDYVIAPGDLVSVRVYNQETMSGRMRVRSDGKITLPFLNDVQAAGFATTALARHIETRLKEFVVNPVVTVSLEEVRPLEVFVLGEVARPGRYALEASASVLHAIAAAGGLTQYANRDGIFVVREETALVRIRFRYEALTRIEGRASTFRLRSGDSVVVE